MGPRGWWIRFVGIALMSVLVVALAQTATPPETASEAYVVVTSAEQVLGTWHVRTQFLRFDGDGTFRTAVGQSALDATPSAIHTYRFEDGEMLVTTLAFVGAPTTGESVGRYEVRLLEGGDLQIVLIEDPNGGRSGHLEWVYAPAASQGDVIVTSAEQVLGTWQYLAARMRFDDGTIRQAWSANTLESAPYATSSYRFEGGEMLVTELAVSGVPTCGDAVGRYRVWLLESGELQIVAIGDPCPARSGDMTRVYQRVESQGYVVVTSAEQIIGTWLRPSRYRRFDEDGTYRSASSANALDGAPSSITSYRFEGGEMLVTEVTANDVPSCGDAVGRYEVRLLESGDLQIVVIEDPCHARAGSTAWVYERVE
jgi:hypothetical protein